MTKLAALFADLDSLTLDRLHVTVSCTASSRNYIYFLVTVTGGKGCAEFSASYAVSNLNHMKTSGRMWEQFFVPKLQAELTEIVKTRSYRANSNIFRALRQVSDEAMATI